MTLPPRYSLVSFHASAAQCSHCAACVLVHFQLRNHRTFSLEAVCTPCAEQLQWQHAVVNLDDYV